jgi:alpha-N-arabinofuranosidase
VSWEDDWPVVNYGVGLVRETENFTKLTPVPFNQPTSFDFREIAEIPLNLMHLRNPIPEDYKIKTYDSNPGLHMRLNKNAITDAADVSYLCIRQQHKSYTVFARMKFAPTSEKEYAGLVVLQSRVYNYQFVLTLKDGNTILRVIKCENGETEILADFPIIIPSYAPDICLKISAREQELSFFYSPDGKIYSTVFENANARILSTDIAGGFVGTTIGMYATSNGADTDGKYAVFTELGYSE